ncbi:hypothetical protein [Opitutus sp. GAS368]|uniref:hypothetical protein n=1 Tax=Opitutus sp. GAS368 TaxID=1882749 RepID=UPI00087C9BD2|nr:hypothetical protein [Opitutus sp. GAS368]SDS52050.1 hypothetical protein SAMN05444173_3140 [Opitutus sp. GAS368]
MTARRSLFLGLAFLLSLRLSATTVEAPDIDSLITQSDYIVRAVVTSATPEWHQTTDGRRYISTRVELEIRDVIKGAPPSPLVLDLIGGRIGQDELVLEGMPQFHAGDEQVLFVHGEQRKMFPLVALMHGVYPVMHEAKSGQDYVMRSNGRLLYSLQDVAQPMEPAMTVRQDPSARPLTAAVFISQIRARAAALASSSSREN